MVRTAIGYTVAGVGITFGAVIIAAVYYVPSAIAWAAYHIKDACAGSDTDLARAHDLVHG